MEVSNQITEIDRAHSSLNEQLRYLEARYQSDRQRLRKGLKMLEQAKQVFAEPPRRGYVASLVPIIEQSGGVLHLTDMLAKLHRIEGFKGVTLASLEATLSSELKSVQPRIRRVGPRLYAITPLRDMVLTPRAA